MNIVGNAKLGVCIRQYREAAELSQTDLGKASGVKQSYIAAAEGGRYQVIYPEPFNALRRALRFPGWIVLEAMGYRTDADGEGMNPALAALIRAMNDDQQLALLALVRAWPKS